MLIINRFWIFLSFGCLHSLDASIINATHKDNGVIKSPNFPAPYPDNQDITWNIFAPQGYQVVLFFTTFDLENSYDVDLGGACVYDYVEVRKTLIILDGVLWSKKIYCCQRSIK